MIVITDSGLAYLFSRDEHCSGNGSGVEKCDVVNGL